MHQKIHMDGLIDEGPSSNLAENAEAQREHFILESQPVSGTA